MSNIISNFLNRVYNLNNSGNYRNTSSEKAKSSRSISFEVQDIVAISSRNAGKHSDPEKTNIISAGGINKETGLSEQYQIDKSNSPVKTSANSGQNEYKTSDMLSSAYEMKNTEAGKLFNKVV